MYSVLNNPEIAKKTGVTKQVAREFINATPKRTFKKIKERLKKKI